MLSIQLSPGFLLYLPLLNVARQLFDPLMTPICHKHHCRKVDKIKILLKKKKRKAEKR